MTYVTDIRNGKHLQLVRLHLTGMREEYFGEFVTTPTLIMPGEQDRAIPLWAQKTMLDIFPNSR